MRLFHWPALIVVVCLLVGCSGKDASTGQGAQPRPFEPTKKVVEDRSLTTEEYIKRGVPSPDKVWGPEDVRAAYEALSKMAFEDATCLPRFDSPRSGNVFSALTSNACLPALRDRTKPMAQRFMPCMTCFESLNQVLKIYFAPFMNQQVAARDIVELQGAILEGAALMTELMDEFLVTLDPKDPTYPVRIEGLKKARTGMAMTVQGMLTCLTETHLYGQAERRRLLERATESVPRLVAFLDASDRDRLLSQMEALSLDVRQVGSLRPQVAELHRITKEAVAARAASSVKTVDTTTTTIGPAMPEGMTQEFHGVQIGTPDANGLYPAKATKGHFSIVFPGPYNDLSITGKDDQGNPMYTHTMGTQTMLNVKYSAVRMCASKSKRMSLDELKKSMLPKLGHGEARDLVYQGFPAIELRGENGKMSFAGRFLLADTDFFIVSVEYPSHLKEKLGQEIDRYLDSLKIETFDENAAHPPAP